MTSDFGKAQDISTSQRRPGVTGWLLMSPLLAWLLVFVVIPTGIMIVYSFGDRTGSGQMVFDFGWRNYERLFLIQGGEGSSPTIDPVYTRVLPSALLAAAAATVLAFIGALFWSAVAQRPFRDTPHRITLVIIPVAVTIVHFALVMFGESNDGPALKFSQWLIGEATVLLLVFVLLAAFVLLFQPQRQSSGMPLTVFILLTFGLALCVAFDHEISNFSGGGIYLKILWQSIKYAGYTTIICVLVGYPVAYFIARCSETKRNLLLMLVMIPFWTSFLIRTYAWIQILRNQGLLNALLMYTKIISEPLDIMYTPLAVMIGLVYAYLPFMILPIYGSVEKLDNALIEAAMDLGATPVRAFSRVIVPLTQPGIVAGCLLVFVPAIGMFAIPDLMGGRRVPMIGNVIQNQFVGQARNWPFGSALGITLLILFILTFVLFTRRRPSYGSPPA